MDDIELIIFCLLVTVFCHLLRLKGYESFFKDGHAGQFSVFRNYMVSGVLIEFTGLFALIGYQWLIVGPVFENSEAYFRAIVLWTVIPVLCAASFEIFRLFYERRNGIPHIVWEAP